MKISSHRIANSISQILPKFLPIESFIYCRNPVLMLRGFGLDMPPGGCYVWKFYLPLFESVDVLSMSLGYRIPGGYIDTIGRSAGQISAAAIDIIRQNDDFLYEEKLEELVSFSKNSMVSRSEMVSLLRKIEVVKSQDRDKIIKISRINRERFNIIS